MAYTFGQLKKIVEHCLAGKPDNRISSGFIVNEAVQMLFDAYEWTWKTRTMVAATVAGTGEVLMPENFGGLISIEAKDYSAGFVFEGLRPSIADPTRYAAIIDPIPSASIADAFTVTYKAEPTRLQEDDSIVAPGTVTGTITNDDGIVTVSSSAEVTEDGATNILFTFTRTNVTSDPITVNFSVAGTATYETDYTQTGAATFSETAGTVVILADEAEAIVTINPVADSDVELDETVDISVTAGTGYALTETINTYATFDDDVVIPIPSSAQPALVAICRAKAAYLEIDPLTPEYQAADAAIKMAIRKDQKMAPPVSRKMEGTIGLLDASFGDIQGTIE